MMLREDKNMWENGIYWNIKFWNIPLSVKSFYRGQGGLNKLGK